MSLPDPILKDTITEGWIIADRKGRPKFHTLSTSKRKAWFALYGRKLTIKEHKQLKNELHAEFVRIRSYSSREL